MDIFIFKLKRDTKDKPMTDMYGAVHLLRLFGEIICVYQP